MSRAPVVDGGSYFEEVFGCGMGLVILLSWYKEEFQGLAGSKFEHL